MMHHYLLTRFNLALWQEDKNGQTIDMGKWIRKRLKLFETYSLLLMLVYCVAFFTLETFCFFNWVQWLLSIGGSLVLSEVLLIVVDGIRKK